MRYELIGSALKIHAEERDDWKGSTCGHAIELISGIECLTCGEVRRISLRKTGRLCIRLSDKPELQKVVGEWKAALAAEKATKEAAVAAELAAILSGETVIEPRYHDGEYLSGYEVHGRAAELLEEIGVAKYISGWGYEVEPKALEVLGQRFTYPQAREFAKPIIERKEAAKKAAAEHATQIKARRAELIAAGKRLATPKQLAVIDRARSDWFDLFDGAGSYGMYGPTDDDLETMTIEEASNLVGAIIAARKAGE